MRSVSPFWNLSPELGSFPKFFPTRRQARDCDAHKPLSGLLDKVSAVWQPPKVPPRVTPMASKIAYFRLVNRTPANLLIWWKSWRISPRFFHLPFQLVEIGCCSFKSLKTKIILPSPTNNNHTTNAQVEKTSATIPSTLPKSRCFLLEGMVLWAYKGLFSSQDP